MLRSCCACNKGGAKQGGRPRHSENGGAPRSTVKRVGGGYLHTPPRAPPNSSQLPVGSDGDSTQPSAAKDSGSPKQSLPQTSALTPAAPGGAELAAAAEDELAAVLATFSIAGPQAAQPEAAADAVDALPIEDILAGGHLQSGNGEAGQATGSTPGKQPEATSGAQAAAPQQPAAVQKGTPHGYVPSALKPGSALLKRELVLGSPSTRASTPQSRTQVTHPSCLCNFYLVASYEHIHRCYTSQKCTCAEY